MRRGFTVHHNGPPANCINHSHSRCIDFWNAVVRFHTNPKPIGKGWSGVAYSFGVCPHGERFTGRGWTLRQWANGSDEVGPDDGEDSEWFSVLVFVGGDDSTHDNEPPTAAMIDATADLIQDGRDLGLCGDRVTPHNFWKRKPCPGPEFEALCKAWDRKPNIRFNHNPNPGGEDDVSFTLTHYKGPGKPPRVFVDGSLVGFPNQTEMDEFLAPYRAAKYEERTIVFKEEDDWNRYMDGGVMRVQPAIDLLSNGDRFSLLAAAGVNGAAGADEPGDPSLGDQLADIREKLGTLLADR